MGDTNVKIRGLEELLLVLAPEGVTTTAADHLGDIDSHLTDRTGETTGLFQFDLDGLHDRSNRSEASWAAWLTAYAEGPARRWKHDSSCGTKMERRRRTSSVRASARAILRISAWESSLASDAGT